MANFVKPAANPDGFNYGSGIEEVTPNDTGNLPAVAILVVGTTGDLRVNTAQGQDVVIPSAIVSALNGVIPVFCTRVYSTNTTATDIWAITR